MLNNSGRTYHFDVSLTFCSLLRFEFILVFSILFAKVTVYCRHAQSQWFLRKVDAVDRIEILEGMRKTNKERGDNDMRRCLLFDLQNPFENSTIVGSKGGQDSAKFLRTICVA